MTPPENVQREVAVYTAIDTPAMLADWWRAADAAIAGAALTASADLCRR